MEWTLTEEMLAKAPLVGLLATGPEDPLKKAPFLLHVLPAECEDFMTGKVTVYAAF